MEKALKSDLDEANEYLKREIKNMKKKKFS